MIKRFLLVVKTLTCLFLLQACTSLQQNVVDTATTESEGSSQPTEKKEINKKASASTSLTGETLYQLLVAEIAGKRNREDIALGNYMKQAHITKDKTVTARAARIAQYLNAHQASLDAALLWIDLEPDNPEPRQIALNEFLHFGRFDNALEQMAAILENSGSIDFSQLVKHTGQLNNQQRTALLTSFNTLLDAQTDLAQAWVAKGLIHEQSGEHKVAMTAIDKAVTLAPDNPAIKLLKTSLISKHEGSEKAVAYLKRATKQHPDHKGLGMAYIKALIASKDLRQAEKQLKTLARYHPDDGDLILSLGLLAMENQLLAQAKKQLKKLIEIEQRVDEAHYYLGQIAQWNNESEEAIGHFTAVSPGALYPSAQSHGAKILFEQGQKDGAYRLLEQSRERYPQGAAHLYIVQGEFLAKENKLTDALRLITEALATRPENSNLLYSRAMIAGELDRLDILEEDLLQIIQKEPDNAMALNALGYTLADRLERYEEAYRYVSRAVRISPEDPAIIDSMGWIYYRQGKHEKALEYLKQAYILYPDHEIAAHLGEVLWVTGNREEANSIWESALDKQPDSKILKETINQFLK